MPYDAWSRIASPSIAALRARLFGMAVIVNLEDQAQFENFVYSKYAEDGFPPNAGISPFGKGIFAINNASKRYHDTTGISPGSPYTLLVAPVMTLKELSGGLMFNLHSVRSRALPIDNIITCYRQANTSNCSSDATDLVQLILDGASNPATIIFSPIAPRFNTSVLVGFTTLVINWKTVFAHNTGEGFEGLVLVLSTSSLSCTYEFTGGVDDPIIFLGYGDLHDKDFEDLSGSHTVDFGFNDETTQYTMRLYPSRKFYEKYNSNLPVLASVGAVIIVAFTSIVFFAYAYAIHIEAIEAYVLIEKNQAFVRFISHEVRTPLNVICLGIDIVNDNVKLLKEKLEQSGVEKDSLYVVELDNTIDEIRSSAHSAVVVLNDLVHMGRGDRSSRSNETSIEFMHPEKFLRDIFRELKSDISDFSLNFTEASLNDCNAYFLVGNLGELKRAFRNVLQHVDKFCKAGGAVDMKVSYDQNGLPDLSIADLKKKIFDNVINNYCRSGSLIVSISEKGIESDGSHLENPELRFSCIDLEEEEADSFDLSIATNIFASYFVQFSVVSSGLTKGFNITIQLPLLSLPNTSSDALIESSSPSHKDSGFGSNITTLDLHLHEAEIEKPNLRRILVVDDSRVSRTMVARVLNKSGFKNVEMADDGITALDILQQQEPKNSDIDLIIMDFEMPRMNGPSTTMKLRELGFDCVVIGLTGNMLPSDIALFRKCGADDILLKPLVIECLYKLYFLAKNKRSKSDSFPSVVSASNKVVPLKHSPPSEEQDFI